MISRRRLLASAGLAFVLPAAIRPAYGLDLPPLILFAAASLKGPLDQVTKAWTADLGVQVSVSFAGSSALARQIEAGAPADLFISADQIWMDYLAGKDLLAGDSRFNLLGNQLVLIAPADTPLSLTLDRGTDLAAALGPDGILAMGDVKAVPAGTYGKQALDHFALWDQVAGRVSNSDNVKLVTALVARGEAPLGIVYRTDALAEPRVKVVATFPEVSHKPIIYPAARLTQSHHPTAQILLDHLRSEPSLAVFRAAGFSTLPGS